MATDEPMRPQTAAPIAPQHQDDIEREDMAPPTPAMLDERNRRSARPRRPMGPVASPDQARDDAEPAPPSDVPPTSTS